MTSPTCFHLGPPRLGMFGCGALCIRNIAINLRRTENSEGNRRRDGDFSIITILRTNLGSILPGTNDINMHSITAVFCTRTCITFCGNVCLRRGTLSDRIFWPHHCSTQSFKALAAKRPAWNFPPRRGKNHGMAYSIDRNEASALSKPRREPFNFVGAHDENVRSEWSNWYENFSRYPAEGHSTPRLKSWPHINAKVPIDLWYFLLQWEHHEYSNRRAEWGLSMAG